jgi:hypothetical protein
VVSPGILASPTTGGGLDKICLSPPFCFQISNPNSASPTTGGGGLDKICPSPPFCFQICNPNSASPTTGGGGLDKICLSLPIFSRSAIQIPPHPPQEEEGWTLDKVAKLGLAGVLSIAVAESVFWVRTKAKEEKYTHSRM